MQAPRVIPIFEYHSISSPQGEQDTHLTVSPKHFAEHMDWLADQGYRTLTLSQYFQHSDTLPERSILLTFDDGYADFAENALPILRHHHFSATLYVVTAYIGQYNEWDSRGELPRRSLLGWKELAALSEEGFEIGSHSHTSASPSSRRAAPGDANDCANDGDDQQREANPSEWLSDEGGCGALARRRNAFHDPTDGTGVCGWRGGQERRDN
jgi:hypothetical protein